MWSALIAPVTGLVTDWIKGKREVQQAKIEGQREAAANAATWEQQMAKASESSWKDEWFTVLLSMPIVAIVYGVITNDPAVIQRVGLAFDQLNALPEWYQFLLIIAVLASFGIRSFDKLLTMMKKR